MLGTRRRRRLGAALLGIAMLAAHATLVSQAAVPERGYWLVDATGNVYEFGGALFKGSASSNAAVVAIAPTPSGEGYWLTATDGAVFAFNAAFKGSLGGIRLNKPVVGMAGTASGNGYWLVAADGGMFTFGDAAFKGSLGGIRLNKPIVGMAATKSGAGYWLVASDGGMFTFGDARFRGSLGGKTLSHPIVGMAPTPDGAGYWLVDAAGKVFNFNAPHFGNAGSVPAPIVAMAATPGGDGYWLTDAAGHVYAFGAAGHSGEADDCNLPAGIVGIAASGPGTAATPPAPRPNCGLPTTTTTTGPPAGSRPNFIVINTDDQRLEGTMAIMPKTRQWIADAGTSFPEGFATTPLCCPSRSGLFSGRYTHNHGNLNNQTTDNLDQNATMQKYLHDAGYQTGMVGKFLLHWSNSTRPPNFDYWALTSGGYYDVSYGTDQGSLRADYTTWETRRQAERILSNFEKRDQDPFFLYIAPQAPHDPWEPETAYKSAAVGTWSPSPAVTETDRSDKPAWVRGFHVDQAEGAQLRAAQLRLLKSVDDMIDAVMRRLTTLGEANNTVVIFTSDNGYLWGEHGVKSKYNPYDQSVRVPFYVRWPGKVAAGAVDRRPVGNVDIAPSLLAAAGISPRLVYPFDGKPFLSPSGLSSVVRPEAYLEYFVDEHRSIPDWFSIRTTKFNYVEYRADGKTIFREYYDLVADPWELRNLLGDTTTANDPDTSALSARLARYRTCTGTTGTRACA